MSAFMCSNRHISILAEYAVARRLYQRDAVGDSRSDQEACARHLFDANAKSLHARYGDPDDMYGPFEFVEGLFAKAMQAQAIAMYKSAQCFAYQACEFTGWDHSLAHNIIESIKSDCISRLPGYETAHWGDVL